MKLTKDYLRKLIKEQMYDYSDQPKGFDFYLECMQEYMEKDFRINKKLRSFEAYIYQMPGAEPFENELKKAYNSLSNKIN